MLRGITRVFGGRDRKFIHLWLLRWIGQLIFAHCGPLDSTSPLQYRPHQGHQHPHQPRARPPPLARTASPGGSQLPLPVLMSSPPGILSRGGGSPPRPRTHRSRLLAHPGTSPTSHLLTRPPASPPSPGGSFLLSMGPPPLRAVRHLPWGPSPPGHGPSSASGLALGLRGTPRAAVGVCLSTPPRLRPTG